jgi:hypothetical protein
MILCSDDRYGGMGLTVRYTRESLPSIPPDPTNFFFHSKILTHCANNLKIAHCAWFCFAAGNRLKNVVITLRHLANQKGRCKNPVLKRAANGV